jgi:hypothetical protein
MKKCVHTEVIVLKCMYIDLLRKGGEFNREPNKKSVVPSNCIFSLSRFS